MDDKMTPADRQIIDALTEVRDKLIDGNPLVTHRVWTSTCIECGNKLGADGILVCPICERGGCNTCMPQGEAVACPECYADIADSSPTGYVIDHPVLDLIAEMLQGHATQANAAYIAVSRASECVEFNGADGRRYEVVVRRIDDQQED